MNIIRNSENDKPFISFNYKPQKISPWGVGGSFYILNSYPSEQRLKGVFNSPISALQNSCCGCAGWQLHPSTTTSSRAAPSKRSTQSPKHALRSWVMVTMTPAASDRSTARRTLDKPLLILLSSTGKVHGAAAGRRRTQWVEGGWGWGWSSEMSLKAAVDRNVFKV